MGPRQKHADRTGERHGAALAGAQDQAGQYFGESVTVDGTLQGNTIHVAGIRKLTSIGIEVGQRAPSFSARDQFGHAQNLGTLKGPKGTVLLFFRSADW